MRKSGLEDMCKIGEMRERKRKPLFRCFAKGVTCLCCMGGNCHAVGHILEVCDCSCRPRVAVADEENRALARTFKYSYYYGQQGYSTTMREDVYAGLWETLVCRRFLCNEGGVCREEPGCGRVNHCGICFQRTNRWEQGIPFIPYRIQMRWINEFLSWGMSGVDNNKGDEGTIAVVTRVRKRKLWDAAHGETNRRDGPPTAEESTFGYQELPFPTRRPVRRPLAPITMEMLRWFEETRITVGTELTTECRNAVIALLYTWKDLFVEKLSDLPVTDLVCHTIPTYPGSRPHRAKDPIYAADEVRWQTVMLPEMVQGGIIRPGTSPWVAKTTWISKKETVMDSVGRWPLRMVHTYCPLNDATIKTNYPMKRIEPILEDLAKPERRCFFSADAAYGFYAVPMHPLHAYKSAFNSILGQFYYMRMPMGLTGAPATYARLKDLAFGPIPAPDPEPPLVAMTSERRVGFRYFVDDDYGAADTFEDLMWLLHDWYFPRIHWARLTLKPSKSAFFVSQIDPLGMTVDANGLRASDRKRDKITQYPVPTNETEVDNFLYLTIYLKALIPGRTEHARILKHAVKREGGDVAEGLEMETGKMMLTGKAKPTDGTVRVLTKRKGRPIGFVWAQEQQDSFDFIKQSIRDNVVIGGDHTRRYYLSVCAGRHGFGGVFFQLEKEDEQTFEVVRRFPKGKERVIQFIAQAYSDTESRYPDIERECLAIVRSLEEIRFMVLNVAHPIVVFSDASALVSLLGKDDGTGRIAGWRVRISEYNIEPRQAKLKDMAIADGLARMPYDSMDQAWTREEEWEDVCGVAVKETNEKGKPQKNRPAQEGGEMRCFIMEATDQLATTPKGETILGNQAVVVYCDGACRKYYGEAKASIGVYFGPAHSHNLGEYVSTTLPQTNQVAELVALRRAIEEAMNLMKLEHRFTSLVVATDSEYVYKGMTEWIYKWKREGTMARIRNGSLFEALDEYMRKLEDCGWTVKLWRIPREMNQEADQLAGEKQRQWEAMLAANIEGKEKWWEKWLRDSWYTDIVYLLLHGGLPPPLRPDGYTGDLMAGGLEETTYIPRANEADRSLQDKHCRARRLRKTKAEAKKFALLKEEGLLVYKEVNGEQAICVVRGEVVRVLYRFHDLHGHFAAGVMGRNLLGRYYWPGRMKDIASWCNRCTSCQMMGPIRIRTSPKLVMALQPMDLLGMDFLGPITPHSRNGSVYILLVVDYFSRYLFAHATQRNSGDAVVQFLEQYVTRIFGWPLAMYVDNGSHFVKGLLPARLVKAGTKLFSAPVSHPRSVGLAERYVQLILAGLRTVIQAEDHQGEGQAGRVPASMDKWDEFLDGVVYAINTRVLKVHGFTPSQLFLGFNVRTHPLDETVVEAMRKSQLVELLQGANPGEMSAEEEEVTKAHYESRLAALEEIRELTRDRVMRSQEERELNADIPRYALPTLGDLVLRRRFVVDKSLGMKLHAKWDGPYKLVTVSQTGTAGEIEDLKTGKRLGRYAFNTLKVFVPRTDGLEIGLVEEGVVAGAKEWVTFAEGLGALHKIPRDVDLRWEL